MAAVYSVSRGFIVIRGHIGSSEHSRLLRQHEGRMPLLNVFCSYFVSCFIKLHLQGGPKLCISYRGSDLLFCPHTLVMACLRVVGFHYQIFVLRAPSCFRDGARLAHPAR